MTTIEEQRAAFLDETVAYYSADTTRRSRNPDYVGCYYRHPTRDAKCAIGRHIPDDKYEKCFENLALHFNIDTYHDETQKKLWNAIPENIQALGAEFLSYIQKLHDTDRNWGVNHLTEAGAISVANIRNKFC